MPVSACGRLLCARYAYLFAEVQWKLVEGNKVKFELQRANVLLQALLHLGPVRNVANVLHTVLACAYPVPKLMV